MKKILISFAVLAIIIFIIFYGQNAPAEEPLSVGIVEEPLDLPPTGEESAETPDNLVEQSSAIITYTDSGFSPKIFAAANGQTIVFKNESSGPLWVASDLHPTHTAYSGTSLKEHCADGATPSFDSCKGIGAGEEYSFKFERSGSWDYHNHSFASHKGTIIIE